MAKTKKKPAPKKARPKRLKQQYLPGCEPPCIPALDKLADEYRELRDERMRLLVDETNASDRLGIAMHEHNLEIYEYDGWIVRLSKTEKPKVEKKKEPKAESNGEA